VIFVTFFNKLVHLNARFRTYPRRNGRCSTGERGEHINTHGSHQDAIKISRLGCDTVNQQRTGLDNPGKTIVPPRLGLAEGLGD
jgi:hypothetical protein